MARIRGLELQFNLLKTQIKSKQDCLVAALHTLLINEGLQCVGTGEDFPDQGGESGSELLPKGWNDNQDVYTLRYTSRDERRRYLVKTVKAAAILHFNIVEDEDAATALSANVNKYVNDDHSTSYDAAYQNLEALKEQFQKDVVDKLLNPPTPKSEQSGSKERRVRSPGTRPNPVPQPSDDFYQDPFAGARGGGRGRGGFPNIGGRDLDPLGRDMGGGMLLDPSAGFRGIRGPPMGPPRGLPPGAVPPGARFDPFGPGIPGPNGFRPNPDHFRPPDDFMDDFL